MQALRSLSCDTAQRGKAGSVETQISPFLLHSRAAQTFLRCLSIPIEPIKQQSLLKRLVGRLELAQPRG